MRAIAFLASVISGSVALGNDGPARLVGVTIDRRVVTFNENNSAISYATLIGTTDQLRYSAATADSQGRLISIPTLVPGSGPDALTGDQVVSISPIDGSTSVLATLPVRLPDVFGVASGPGDLLYISSRTVPGSIFAPYKLYTFDMSSGILTDLITYASDQHPLSIEFGPDGTLWGWLGPTNSAPGLVTINPVTGAITDPFPGVGGIFDNIQAIAFGPDGQLYGTTSFNSGIWRIDTSTGGATRIASLTVPQVGGLATIKLPAPGASATFMLAGALATRRRRR